ncbi:MAG: queuosine precursor transporter [Methylophilaceae bacterium]
MTKNYQYYDLMMAAFVTVLVCSNLIGPAKVTQIEAPLLGTLTFGAGVLFFPISFIFGDILTEVYGYAASRRVIWAGFAGLAFASLMAWMIVALPAAPFWHNQEAYEVAFGSTWRISLAGLIAFAVGEFVNSIIMAKMKIVSAGKHLWQRTITSTIFGESIDTVLFVPLAFWNSGIIPNDKIPLIIGAQIVAKTIVEIVFTPVVYKVVAFLKKAEHEDYYDHHTNFNPFILTNR